MGSKGVIGMLLDVAGAGPEEGEVEEEGAGGEVCGELSQVQAHTG